MDRNGRKRDGPGRYNREGGSDRRGPPTGPGGDRGDRGGRPPRDDYYKDRRDERHGGTRDSPHYSRRRSPRSRSPVVDGKSYHRDQRGDGNDVRRRRSRSPDNDYRTKRDDPRYERSNRYDRDEGKRGKYHSRSPGRDRDRSRSRDHGGRDRRRHGSRSRSRSSSPRGKRHRSPRRDRGRAKNRESEDIDMRGGDEMGDDEDAMMAMMGFGGFGTTKGKKVEGNAAGGVKIERKAEYRQYMNRAGGFNRALSPIPGP